MNLFSRWFGGKAAPSRSGSSLHSGMASGHSQRTGASSPSSASARRDVLRLALREAFQRNGIPVNWVLPELLAATSREGQTGIHVRLVVRHWDPRLALHTVALQNNIITRLHTFDPVAENWLMGISWQFAPDDESRCPPLPHPGSWTAQEPLTQPAPARPPAAGGAGDVIAGPVHIGARPADARAELEKQLARVDGEYSLDKAAAFADQATQPMSLNTEPGKL